MVNQLQLMELRYSDNGNRKYNRELGIKISFNESLYYNNNLSISFTNKFSEDYRL